MSESEYCDQLFRYKLDDADGDLRFVEFELLGSLKGSRLELTLVPYLQGRALESVQTDDLPPACCPDDGGCLNAIIGHLNELKSMVGK